MSFESFPFGTGLNLEILSMGEDVLSMHTLMIYTFSIAHSWFMEFRLSQEYLIDLIQEYLEMSFIS